MKISNIKSKGKHEAEILDEIDSFLAIFWFGSNSKNNWILLIYLSDIEQLDCQ